MINKIINNIKNTSPIFGVIACFAGLLSFFIKLPQESIIRILQQDYILTYLYVLLAISVLIFFICIIQPLIVLFPRINNKLELKENELTTRPEYKILFLFQNFWKYFLKFNAAIDRFSLTIIFAVFALVSLGFISDSSYSENYLINISNNTPNTSIIFYQRIFPLILALIIIFNKKNVLIYLREHWLNKSFYFVLSISFLLSIFKIFFPQNYVVLKNFLDGFYFYDIIKILVLFSILYVYSTHKTFVRYYMIISLLFTLILFSSIMEHTSSIISLLLIGIFGFLIKNKSSHYLLLLIISFIMLLVASYLEFSKITNIYDLFGVGIGMMHGSSTSPILNPIIIITKELGITGLFVITATYWIIFFSVVIVLKHINHNIDSIIILFFITMICSDVFICMDTILNNGIHNISFPFINYINMFQYTFYLFLISTIVNYSFHSIKIKER